jgi:branched-chain amino acid transport system permease protein
MSARRWTRWLLPGLLAIGLAYPVLDQVMGWNRVASMAAALLLVTMALGLSIVVGMAGLLDLGYVAFFAIGGYTSALLTGGGSRVGLMLPGWLHEPWLALPLAGVLAAGFGLAFGIPSIRTRGEYLAIVTLAFGEIVPSVIWHAPYWTGGANGVPGVPLPRLGPLGGTSPALRGYELGLLVATLGCLAALRLARSRLGRAWAATRDDETAAETVGVNTQRAKLLAFAIGAGYAGLAGAVYAGLLGYVEPGQFDLTVSLMVLAAVVIGGRWGIGGVVLGALTVAAYDRVLADAATSALRTVGASVDLRANSYVVFGLALYLAVLLRARSLQDQLASSSDPLRAVRELHPQRAIRLDSEHDDVLLSVEARVGQSHLLAAPPQPRLPGRPSRLKRPDEPAVERPDQSQ